MKLNYKKYGDSGEYIIILHGLFGMLDNWHGIAGTLSETYQVVTVDQRNHGRSPHSDEMNFKVMSQDLLELMDDLGIEKAVIVGHSMGGKTAMTFCDMYPDRVSKLVVVDIAPKRYKPGHTLYFQALKALDYESFESRKEAELQLEEFEPNYGIRLFLLKNMVREPKGGFKLKMNLEGIEKAYPEIIGEMRFSRSYTGEVLFIAGSKSRYIDEEDWTEIKRNYPNAELVTIEDAGHWVHAENPEEFVKVLSNFIA